MGDFNVRPYLALIPYEIQTHICTYLPTASIARLAATCHRTHGSAHRVLYLRNASEEKSSAVKYAILFAANKCIETALRIIDIAICHGAQLDIVHLHPTKPDTYATVLHMAAALGYCSIVERLLEHKARVELPSRNLWNMVRLDSHEEKKIIRRAAPCFASTPSWCPRKVKADLTGVEWLPLFVPFLLRKREIVSLLLSCVPDCRLTRDFQGCGALTGLHIISAMENPDERLKKRVFRLSTNLINEKLPGDAGSALHVALRQRNASMFETLVDKGADLNLQTHDLGNAPIHTAIIRCYEADLPQRKVYQNFVELLVNKGADLNKATLKGFTPLMTLVEAAEWDWKLSHRNMKQLADLFLAKGCNVNRMASGGETFVNLLLERIWQKNGNPSLEALLGEVIDKGANLNIPLPNDKSIAKAFVIDSEKCPRLAKLLVEKGARINDGEVDDVFLRCFKNPRVYKRYEIIKDEKSLVSQDTIDAAYVYAVESKDQKKVDELRNTWGFSPSNANTLVRIALQDPKRTLMRFVLELDFNANTMYRESGSYLHCVVRKIDKGGYTEKVAIDNAKALIEKGTRVLEKDSEGKTAIQRLRESDEELDMVTDKLRLLLLDQKDKELGEW
ncbi:unnamed protein product [Clonostachys rosea]|uniref:F-box domain-containing protein n=1 Tax=Bionectria ochroleuca TaxID=29856 RepID=A0ABY6UH95_BIOOC|nr:unnamed protein product [Clonostachys rosea]